jgi:hypothetical protein
MPLPQLLADVGRRRCGHAAREFENLATCCPAELREDAEKLMKLALWTELKALDWLRRYAEAQKQAVAAVMPA